MDPRAYRSGLNSALRKRAGDYVVGEAIEDLGAAQSVGVTYASVY